MKFGFAVLMLVIGLGVVHSVSPGKLEFLQDEVSEEYDGNIYNLEDTTFGQDVALEILEDVGKGEVNSEQAIAELAIMVDSEWINQAEYEWAYAESIKLEEEAANNQQS